MIQNSVLCNCVFDDPKEDFNSWPKFLSCKPAVGEWIISHDGKKKGLIDSISHSIKEMNDEDGKKNKIPYLLLKITIAN